MKLHHHVFFAVLSLGFVALAQRVDDFTTSAVVVQSVKLTPLPDGGCAAEWCGTVASSDGGVQLYDCAARELGALVNQNRCAGLQSAGVGALSRQLRLALDAGATP